MLIFDINSKCPKCGGTASTDYKYFDRKIGWFGFGKRIKNGQHDYECTCNCSEAHICRDCTVCQASWPEMPLDAVEEKENTVRRGRNFSTLCDNCGATSKANTHENMLVCQNCGLAESIPS